MNLFRRRQIDLSVLTSSKRRTSEHEPQRLPLLNCQTPFDTAEFKKNLPSLARQIAEAAEEMPTEQNTLYETAYTAQMIAAFYADISMMARNAIYVDTVSHSTERLALFAEIHDLLMQQVNSDIPYVYETGYLYQGIDSLVLMGSRDAEHRYHNYQLYNHLTPGMTILDVGANCGFMGLFAARNLGCYALCMDHNPFMLEVGKLVARHFKVEDRLSFETARIQDMVPVLHDAVFSFASHWTDDGGIRNTLLDHFRLLMRFVKPNGRIFFESHCNDLTDENYEESLAHLQKELDLEISYRKLLDNGTRDYIVFQHTA